MALAPAIRLLRNSSMRRPIHHLVRGLLLGIVIPSLAISQISSRFADSVRAEFLHAWNGYKQYAWGHDELRPLSKSYHDWHTDSAGRAVSLYMTPIDAMDVMMLMGLTDEAAKTREFVATNLSFDHDVFVKNFEITIRLLGGLLSNFQLSGDKRLLALARDLGDRLLPVFNSPTGMPYTFVNLKTGAVRDSITNP